MYNGRVVGTTPRVRPDQQARGQAAAGRFLTDEDERSDPPTTWPCSAPSSLPSCSRSRTRSARPCVISARTSTSSSWASSRTACRRQQRRPQAAEEFNNDVYIPLKTCQVRFGEKIIHPHHRAARGARAGRAAPGDLTVDDTMDTDVARDRVRQRGRHRTFSAHYVAPQEGLGRHACRSTASRKPNAPATATRMLLAFDRRHLAAGRRHRHHEHHAGHRDRAHPRDRHPPRPGRQAPRHHLAVPHRGRGADHASAGWSASSWA